MTLEGRARVEAYKKAVWKALDCIDQVIAMEPEEYGHVNVRRLEEFTEMVQWPDGQLRRRFCPVGEVTGE